MKALSIRQPWAWLIVNGYKDIENRNWRTHYRGPILIHASQAVDAEMMRLLKNWSLMADDATGFLSPRSRPDLMQMAAKFNNEEALHQGGIVGAAELVDCVEESDSQWFQGKYGLILKEPKVLPFAPYKGRLSLFDVHHYPYE